MADQTTPTLGKLIEAGQQRDAIHIAVAPVIAEHVLAPGVHVGFAVEGNTELVGCGAKVKLGVVDPFLKEVVLKGQRFWMFLYPQTITSLRHDWTHPAFSAPAESNRFSRLESEAWLRNYAIKQNCYDDPGEAFRRLIDGLETGELHFRGSDLHGLYELEDADELKYHAEKYLGIKINWPEFTFSCSC